MDGARIPARALAGGFQVGANRRGLYEFGVCLNGKGQLPACKPLILGGHREAIEVTQTSPLYFALSLSPSLLLKA